ncbi:leucine rich repeat protein, putative [Leishmania tarentolae]|uniref:Leucine rich repeat protein, putative n=1 Tax=Leishmania tarentolae TaxID=5689 RepID=A0A640KC39_LEITA|nr:leucine rich repeat protein, putative [Leishmania tarentolae]
MKSEVVESPVPRAQKEIAVSAALASAPRQSIDRQGSLTRNSSIGNAIAGERKRATPPPSPASLSARLYKDPCAETPDRRIILKASSHPWTPGASHARLAGSALQGRKSAAAVMKQPPLSPSIAAQRVANADAVEESAACSADEPFTDPAVSGSAQLSKAVESRIRTTCTTLLPSGGVSTEFSAAAEEPVKHAEVLCVTLPEMPVPQRSQAVPDAGGRRLDLRMRGLVALPCLHVSEAFQPASADSTHESTAPSSTHGSGDVAAGRLHAVSFRQNAISNFFTQCADPMSTPQTSPAAPRSSPLQCYAHVSSLDLAHNALTSIAGIEVLRCLRSLRLAFNRLTSLAPLWASPYVAQLDVLDVSSNALTALLSAEDVHALKGHQIRIVTHPTQAHGTAHGYPNVKLSTSKAMQLRVLYASNNQICEVPSAIYTFAQLTDLRLNKNVIESVPKGFPVRACMPKLACVDLTMNRLPADIVEAVTARAEESAESPLHRCSRPTASLSVAKGNDYNHTSARRSHGGTDPPADAQTATLSSSSLSARKTMDGASSEEEGRGAAQRLQRRRAVPSSAPGEVNEIRSEAAKEGNDVSATHVSGRQRSPAAAPKVAVNAELNRSRDTPPQVKADAVVSPQLPAKKYHESPSATALSSSTKNVAAFLPPTAPAIATVLAQEGQQAGAAQCVAENVYSVDLSVWAGVVRRRLEEVLRRSPGSGVSGALNAAPTCSMHELLVCLCDALGGSSSGSGATALPRYRRRQATTARMIAALQQCLPSRSIFYNEETQVRCPPRLLLTGISAAVAADESELLLYEVLALHIVHNCLCTAKSANGVMNVPYAASTTSSQALHSPEQISQPTCKDEHSSAPFLRAKTLAVDRASSGGELPPLRPGSSGSPGSGRGGGTARQLRFAVPLQTIHVIACTDAAATTLSSTSAVWAYLTWRQRWEAAVSRRRFPNKSDYVCELGKRAADENSPHPLESNPPPVAREAKDNGAHTAPHRKAPIPVYPFTANSPLSGAREVHWLHQHRPASYCAMPPAWELLYDLLQPSASERTASKRPHVPSVPPLLAGGGGRVQHLHGAPLSLTRVLCAVDRSSSAGTWSTCASLALPVLCRNRPDTEESLASGAGNGTSVITVPYAPCEDVIRRALQWRQHSQKLSSHLESEANTVAAEQVTLCSMPLYSAEEVVQSQQAAVAALRSLDARNRRPRCEQLGPNNVSEEGVESAAASGKEAPQPTML